MPPVPRRLTSDTTVKTPGDISLETETETQDGHFHEDGTWHAAPHAPVEVSEAEVSDDVQGAPVGAQQANTQREAPMQASDADTQTDIDINRAWIEWGNKHLELAKKRSQAGKEIIAAMPATEAELERFENDPEWQRKLNEALHKAAKIDAMLKVFEQEKPARP